MPRARVEKERLLEAAMQLLEERGQAGVTVAGIAARAGCSVVPVYSWWNSMNDMWAELDSVIARRIRSMVAERLNPDDPLRSTGRAFAAVAAEHPHLFRAFAGMRRPDITSLSELAAHEADPAVAVDLADRLHIPLDAAQQLHLHMLIYNVGLCTIYASCSTEMAPGEIFSQLEKAYEAFAAGAVRGA